MIYEVFAKEDARWPLILCGTGTQETHDTRYPIRAVLVRRLRWLFTANSDALVNLLEHRRPKKYDPPAVGRQ